MCENLNKQEIKELTNKVLRDEAARKNRNSTGGGRIFSSQNELKGLPAALAEISIYKNPNDVQKDWATLRSWIGLFYRYGKEAQNRCQHIAGELQEKSTNLVELDSPQFFARICRISQDHMIALKAAFLRRLSIYREIIKQKSTENSEASSNSSDEAPPAATKTNAVTTKNSNTTTTTGKKKKKKRTKRKKKLEILDNPIKKVEEMSHEEILTKHYQLVSSNYENETLKTNMTAELFLKEIMRELEMIDASCLMIEFVCPTLYNKFIMNFGAELNWKVYNYDLFNTIVLGEEGIKAVYDHGLKYINDQAACGRKSTYFNSQDIKNANKIHEMVLEYSRLWRPVQYKVMVAALKKEQSPVEEFLVRYRRSKDQDEKKYKKEQEEHLKLSFNHKLLNVQHEVQQKMKEIDAKLPKKPAGLMNDSKFSLEELDKTSDHFFNKYGIKNEYSMDNNEKWVLQKNSGFSCSSSSELDEKDGEKNGDGKIGKGRSLKKNRTTLTKPKVLRSKTKQDQESDLKILELSKKLRELF